MAEVKTKTIKKVKESPKQGIERKTHNLDAEDKVLGRLATGIAMILRGKNKPSFRPYIDGGDIVNVVNASKMKITGKKLEQKKYYHHSGYPGGLRTTLMKELEPSEMLRRAVYYMLPKNKLRAKMMKRLNIKN